jgi:hypothetical protein
MSLPAAVREPSGCMVTFPGPVAFSVMAVPVLRFVNEAFREPVTRLVSVSVT